MGFRSKRSGNIMEKLMNRINDALQPVNISEGDEFLTTFQARTDSGRNSEHDCVVLWIEKNSQPCY